MVAKISFGNSLFGARIINVFKGCLSKTEKESE